ncbi:MAG: extracellular solute-binding protein [Anaerolineae bacterium]|nr:extracellular solute-binding protein [Anaerolineae bacterium]
MECTTRRLFLKRMTVIGSGLALAACQPKVVEVEKVVEKVVTQVVEKEVTKIVEGTPQVVKETVVVEKQVTAVPAKKEQVTLTFHHIDAANYGSFTEYFNKTFVEPRYPHIKTVSAFFPGWSEYLPKIMTMAAAGTIGDIIFSFTPNWLATMVAKEVFCNHDELAAADNFDFSPYFPAGIEGCTMRGHLRSMPWHAHAGHTSHVMNVNLFEEAGVEPLPTEEPYEWDIESELDWASAITKEEGGKTTVYGRTLSTGYDHIVAICQSFGGHVISEDGRSIVLGEDAGRQAMKWIYDRAYTHKYAPTAANIEGNERQMFVSGKLGVYQVVASHVPAMLLEVGDRFQIGTATHGTGPAGVAGAIFCVNTLGITNNCKHKTEAWQALAMHCGHDAGVQKVLYGAGSPGGRYDCFDDPEIIRRFAPAALLKYQMDHTHPDPLPWNWRCDEFRSALTQNLDTIWVGDTTVDEGVDKTVAALEDVLKLEEL